MTDEPMSSTVRTDAGRQAVHTRRVELNGYLRDDGLFEIEATLVDLKARDYPIATGTRRAGEAIHDLGVCVTFDASLRIVAARAVSRATPYPGACDTIAPAYEALVGLELMHGFRAAVRERLGGLAGCSHLTELLMSVPTVALQTLASFRRENEDTGQQPFQLDRCHALDTRGETVRRYYPRWFRSAD
jgi:hypothetical protein